MPCVSLVICENKVWNFKKFEKLITILHGKANDLLSDKELSRFERNISCTVVQGYHIKCQENLNSS